MYSAYKSSLATLARVRCYIPTYPPATLVITDDDFLRRVPLVALLYSSNDSLAYYQRQLPDPPVCSVGAQAAYEASKGQLE